MRLPNACKTGRARRKVSGSAPTMTVRVPARAPLTPPLTGASAKATRWRASVAAILREVAGSPEVQSNNSDPARKPARRPSGPSSRASTSCEVGRQVTTTSAPAAASRGVRTARAAWVAANSSARAAVRFHTRSGSRRPGVRPWALRWRRDREMRLPWRGPFQSGVGVPPVQTISSIDAGPNRSCGPRRLLRRSLPPEPPGAAGSRAPGGGREAGSARGRTVCILRRPSFGVHAGMPIAEAVRLCPEATFFQGAFGDYSKASHAVREVLEDFSPVVVMSSLDEAYLDFGGTERL